MAAVARLEELYIGLKINVGSPHSKKRMKVRKRLSSQCELQLPLGERNQWSKKHLSDSVLVSVSLLVLYSQEFVLFFEWFFPVKFSI